VTETVFNVVAKNPQVEHVAADVKPAAVEKHRGQKNLGAQSKPVQAAASYKADRDYAVGGYEWSDTLAKGEFVEKYQYVQNYERDGNNRETARWDCIL